MKNTQLFAVIARSKLEAELELTIASIPAENKEQAIQEMWRVKRLHPDEYTIWAIELSLTKRVDIYFCLLPLCIEEDGE